LNIDLADAIRRDDVAAIEQWLDGGGSPNAGFEPGERLLLLAVEAGSERIVQRLLEAGADPGSDPWHEDEDLPLWSAMHFGRWAIALRLIDAGAVEKADARWLPEVLEAGLASRGKQKSTVIAAMVTRVLARFEEAPLPIADHLLKAASKLLKRSPSTRALGEKLAGRVDEVKALEEELVDLYAEKERLDDALALLRATAPALKARLAASFLPWLVEGGDVPRDVIAEVLELAGEDIDRPDPSGRTALMYAAHDGDLDLVRTLVARGANIRHVEHTDGYSVLEYADLGNTASPVFDEILRRLHESAAAFDARVDAQRERLPEAERAADATHHAVEAASERRWDRVEELLAHGADINGRDRLYPRRARTLVAHATWQGDRDRVLWLVERGASLEVKREIEDYARCADGRNPDPKHDAMYRFVRQLRKKLRNIPDVTLEAEDVPPTLVDVSVREFFLGVEGVPDGWPARNRVRFRLRCGGVDVEVDGEMNMKGPGFAHFFLRDLHERQTAQLEELRRLLSD
jgi:ankyrin repeat protein